MEHGGGTPCTPAEPAALMLVSTRMLSASSLLRATGIWRRKPTTHRPDMHTLQHRFDAGAEEIRCLHTVSILSILMSAVATSAARAIDATATGSSVSHIV